MSVPSMASSIADLTQRYTQATGPAYARIRQSIEQLIQQGEWQPGQMLPSEAELVEALSVSRMTANRAMRELTEAGLVKRPRGRGTFVAEQKILSALFEVHDIAAEITARSKQHHARVIELVSACATAEEAMRLGVITQAPIFRSTVLHYEDNLPLQLEQRIINAKLAPHYDQQDLSRHTAHRYLMQAAPMTEGEHLVEAVLANADEAELLQIEASEPCMQIRRRTWAGNDIVSATRLLSPGSRFELFGRFGPSHGQ